MKEAVPEIMWTCNGSWGVWGPLWMGFWFGIAAANFLSLIFKLWRRW